MVMARRLIDIGLILGIVFLGLWLLPKESLQSQQSTENMRVMIQDLTARGKQMVFTFAEPVAPNLTIYETNGQDLRIGDDFVCISEPWNSDRRYRCTPYSNVVSITFTD